VGYPELQDILPPRTGRILLIVLKGRNIILFLKNKHFTEKLSKTITPWQRK
jgi:hypothetical protein